MRNNIFPRTTIGKWTFGLAIAALVLFIFWRIGLATKHPYSNPGPPPDGPINWFVVVLYDLLLTLITAIAGLISIIIKKEHSLLVILITTTGFLVVVLALLLQYLENLYHW